MEKFVKIVFKYLLIISFNLLAACVGDVSGINEDDRHNHNMDSLNDKKQYSTFEVSDTLTVVLTEPVLVESVSYNNESAVRVSLYVTGKDNDNYKLNIEPFQVAGRSRIIDPIIEVSNAILPTIRAPKNCILNANVANSYCILDISVNNNIGAMEFEAPLELIINQNNNSIIELNLVMNVSLHNKIGYFLLHDKYIKLSLSNK